MPAALKTLHLRLCLGAIALMVTVPFLMAHHYHPIPSFFQEWTAATLSLVALTLLLRREGAPPLEVPEIALLPAGLLVIAVLQWIFQPNALPDRLQLFGCYMAWTLFLVILGRHLAKICGLQRLAEVLATALLVGALLEALSGAAQLAGVARLPWVFPSPGGSLKGNLAQPNNFADYLWLGIGSAIYLRSRGHLGRLSTTACLLILTPFGVLSGSRSVFLYGIGLAALSVVWTWRDREIAVRALRRWSLAALAGTLFFELAFSNGWIPLPGAVATAGMRMAQESYDPMRLVLWRQAFGAFLENPWLGVGFGQYTRYFHQHVLDLMPYRLPGLPEHAHNITLHLLAEMGLAAGLLLLTLGARWAWKLGSNPPSPEVWWIAAAMLILGIHSNLEYPLWYGFFLGIAALLAGAGSQANKPLELSHRAPFIIAAFLTLGAMTLLNLHQDYRLLEDTLNGRLEARSPEDRLARTSQAFQRLARESLLRPYVDLAVAHLMADDNDAVETKLGNCERAQRFSASRDIVFKCAHIAVLAGHEEEGRLALRRAVASYPDRAELVLAQWRKRSAKEPTIARMVADFPPIAKAAQP